MMQSAGRHFLPNLPHTMPSAWTLVVRERIRTHWPLKFKEKGPRQNFIQKNEKEYMQFLYTILKFYFL